MPSNAHYTSDPRLGAKANVQRSAIRRRRGLLCGLLLLVVGFVYFVPWDIPTMQGGNLTRANFLSLVKNKKVDVGEIYGLLHLVTGDANQDDVLNNPQLDPTSPLKLSFYAPQLTDSDWAREKVSIDKQYPVVVFSKTYCPYSARAKALLEAYDIQPPPKIVEVDLRDDASAMKPLLTRLTAISTVPNIIIRGKSIGGSTDLIDLHRRKELIKLLKENGATARRDGSSFEKDRK